MVIHWTQRLSFGFRLVAIVCVLACQLVDAQQPQPDKALQRLQSWVGKWSYAGELQASPFGPAGKFTGELRRQLILNDFFLEEQWHDKTESYFAQGVIVTGYDPSTKMFTQSAFENDGSVSHGSASIEGNSFKTKLSRTDKSGTPYLVRLDIRLADDGAPQEEVAEYSMDEGQTWRPYFELKFEKID